MTQQYISYSPFGSGGGGGAVNSVTASAPIASSGGANPNISIQLADATHNGYLSSTDWNTFNSKQSALTFGNLTEATSSILTITGGTGAVIGSGASIQVQLADSTHSGYLSSTDWNTFNNKQSALTLPLSIANGGTGESTAPNAINALLPTQTGNNGKFLTTDGSVASWASTTDTGITQLTSDVTAGPGSGSQAATVAFVGGVSASNVASGANLANAATNANTASTIVKRDASGDFSAGIITASLSGNATNVSGIVAPANGGTGIANNAASTLTISGNFATTLTVTATTSVTLPTSGTLNLGTDINSGAATNGKVLTANGSGGSSWQTAPGATSNSRLDAMWVIVIGSSAQVTSGVATHSSWSSAISAASANDTIKVLPGSWTENVTINKTLFIEGSGYGSYVNGTIEFTSAADHSSLTYLRASDNITLDAGADLINVQSVWLASGKTFIDNGTGNYLQAFQET